MENWNDIPSLPGYMASDLGRIQSIDRLVTDSRGRSYWVEGRILALTISPNGYPRFRTAKGTHAVHVAVLEAFVGPRPEGLQGAHGNGIKTDCRLANLRWATKGENAADKQKHGTAYCPTGERHHRVKLTKDQVLEIRAAAAQGAVQRALAKAYDVHFGTIGSIVSGKSWRHLLPEQSDMRAMGKVG